MTSPGQLSIRARWDDGAVNGLTVELHRPSVSRLFVGQAPAVVVKLVPHLYALCAEAQRAAAEAALAAAAGRPPAARNDAALWLEMLHENFWRLLLDWPVALGLPSAKTAFVAWRSLRQGDAALAASEQLLQTTLNGLAEKCLEKLVDRSTLAVGPASPAESPDFAAEAWLAYWQGAVSQMPAVVAPGSIRAAYLARLAAVRQAVTALADAKPYPLAVAGAGDDGVARILTARGLLTHAVSLNDGAVAKYRVWAPTDVFFGDATALSALIDGRRFVNLDQMRQAINQAILALDPCLPYVMELNDA